MKYAITNKVEFNPNSRICLADFILFRDKLCKDYEIRAQSFIENFKGLGAKLFIHDDFCLADKLGANGVHFSSKNIEKIANTPKNLIKIASIHGEYELRLACQLGADYVTFSPVFASPNKGEPKGLAMLEYMVGIANAYNVALFALGGILDLEQIKNVKKAGACGFASIRYFES